MDRGFYWIAQLPTSQHVVLYADPVLKTIHTQVGVFDTHIEAIRFCRKKRIVLASTQREMHKKPKPLREELPPLQNAVYATLMAHADEDGVAKISHAQLMKGCRMANRGNLLATLNSLHRRGLVVRLESGWGDEPYTYQLRVGEQKQKRPPSEESGQEAGSDSQETTRVAVKFPFR